MAEIMRKAPNEEMISAIPEGYVPLPNISHPWLILPVDDSGPFYYFVNYLLSSRHARRRWLIRILRIVTCLGGHRLWPLIAPMLAPRSR